MSGEAESGDDIERVEKEDVPSEVVDTKTYKRERLRNIQTRLLARIILQHQILSERSQILYLEFDVQNNNNKPKAGNREKSKVFLMETKIK